MNISELTLARLNKKEEKAQPTKEEPKAAEPITDVKDFFRESLKDFSQVTLSPQEQYQKFLAENPQRNRRLRKFMERLIYPNFLEEALIN